jgi:hypothetical protein
MNCTGTARVVRATETSGSGSTRKLCPAFGKHVNSFLQGPAGKITPFNLLVLCPRHPLHPRGAESGSEQVHCVERAGVSPWLNGFIVQHDVAAVATSLVSQAPHLTSACLYCTFRCRFWSAVTDLCALAWAGGWPLNRWSSACCRGASAESAPPVLPGSVAPPICCTAAPAKQNGDHCPGLCRRGKRIMSNACAAARWTQQHRLPVVVCCNATVATATRLPACMPDALSVQRVCLGTLRMVCCRATEVGARQDKQWHSRVVATMRSPERGRERNSCGQVRCSCGCAPS